MSALPSVDVSIPAHDPIARSTRQPGLNHYAHPSGTVAFVSDQSISLTLGAPLCAPTQRETVARDFCDAHPEAAFFYVTDSQLRSMPKGWRTIMPVGTDVVLPLPLQAVPDAARSALRKAMQKGVTLEEPASLLPWAAEMRAVQSAYLQGKEVKAELRFLNRPCEFEAECDARTFLLRQRGAVIGFVVLDAYCTESGGRGFLLNLFRLAPTKLWNVYQAVVLLLAEQLHGEGVQELSLGFVPLTAAETPLPLLARVQHQVLRWLARRSPYLQRLGTIKHGFHAKHVTRYLASPRRFVFRDFRLFLSAMGAP